MKKSLLHIVIALTIALPLALLSSGCRDGNMNEVVPTTYDIVCLNQVSKSLTVFTLTKPGNRDLISYTCNGQFDTTYVKVGQRMLLAYHIPNGGVPYRSGNIEPIGYSLITNDKLRRGNISDVENWDRDPVYMISAWMSQDYLNIRARLPYDTKERLLAVMVDESSLDNEYPDCYLIHRLEEPVNTFERNYYTSFDMSALRKLPACKGFNLILNNSNLQRDTYKFELD